MLNIALLVVCLISGVILRRTPLFDHQSPMVLNRVIIYFFLPVLTLHHVPKLEFEWNLIWLSITPFMVYCLAYAYIQLMKQFTHIDRASEGALIMSSGIGSTSFVGFPIFEILYGPEGLSYGIVMSLAGTILVFNTLGVGTGLYYSNFSHSSSRRFWWRLLRFPPLLAFLLALVINVLDVSIPPLLGSLFEKLAAPFSVIALLAIGMQIDWRMDSSFLNYLGLGQLYKLILAPLLIYLFMWHVLGIQDLLATICVLGAGIGSMNSISILAAEMGLNPRLAMFMPAVSIPVSIPLLFLIDFLLH